MSLPQSLNFLDVQRKASSSRSYRSKLSSSNAKNFVCGDEIVWDLPGNVANSYYDLGGTAYVSFEVENTSNQAIMFDGQCGAYSLWNRMSVTSAGATLSNVTGLNNLINVLFSTTVSPQYTDNIGRHLLGTTKAFDTGDISGHGFSIAAAGKLKVCLPLICLGITQLTPARYLPAFSRDRLQIRLQLENAVTAFFAAAAGNVANSLIKINTPELTFYTCELAPEVNAAVMQMTGGKFEMMANDWIHATSSVSTNDSALTSTLGFTSGSLESVGFSHRPSAFIADVTKHSFARVRSNLDEWVLSVNGKLYPNRPIVCKDSGAEALAELLCSRHEMHNFHATSSIGDGYAIDTYNGVAETEPSFYTAVELESFAQTDRVYAGINTVSATTQLQLKYHTNPAVNAVIDIYGLRSVKYVLDMTQLGTYEVYI